MTEWLALFVSLLSSSVKNLCAPFRFLNDSYAESFVFSVLYTSENNTEKIAFTSPQTLKKGGLSFQNKKVSCRDLTIGIRFGNP